MNKFELFTHDVDFDILYASLALLSMKELRQVKGQSLLIR